MARLPIPGKDQGTWGDILNGYLLESHNNDGTLKDIPESKIIHLESDLAAKANTADLSNYMKRDVLSLSLSDFLAPGQAMPSDGVTDAAVLIQSAINQAATLYAADGLVRAVHFPTGKFLLNASLTPPAGGGFGIIGAGMDQTVFITGVDLPFLLNPTNPDPWTGTPLYKDMVFREFTIDGVRHSSDTYNSNRKGIFIQRVQDTEFYRVKIKDVNATGFGLDYCNNVSFVNCVADGCGKGRFSETDLSARVGSGAGIGIGAGGSALESVTVLNCLTINCGTNGIFIEHLGRVDGYYESAGYKIIGNMCVNNNIGIGDQGSLGTIIQGNVCRDNKYAGFRVGVSSANQQGGYDGQCIGNTFVSNETGVMVVGTSLGGYSITNNSIIDSKSYGIWFPQLTLPSWVGSGYKINDNRIMRSGGSGIFADNTGVLSDIEISGNTIKDNGFDATKNYRDGATFLTALGRPRILRNRFTGNFGPALALKGTAITVSPRIYDNDYDGSPGGTYLQEHTITDTTNIKNNIGNSTTTVTNLITIPSPKTATTGWSGVSTTRTRIEGGYLGNGAVQGVATSGSPRITAPTITVSAGQMWTGSLYVKAAAGKKVQSALLAGSTYLVGPIYRTTGGWQRIFLTAIMPAGTTTLRVGVIGVTFAVGDVIEADAAMLTPGPDLWPYIDGAQLHCSWSGAAYASTSVMTLPS